MIDFHNHLIPGVDDGASDADQTRAALEAFRAQGVDRVIATPHVSGETTLRPAELAEALGKLDRGWAQAQAVAAGFPDMQLMRGAEVMLDTPEPDLSDPRLRLAGTSFVLVEFPFMVVPPNGPRALFDLKMAGWTPVLAHPERYGNAMESLEDASEWRRVGALLQVNCGSVLGRYGDRAQKLAWGLLKAGWVDYLSSDYHARGTLPVAECRAELERRGAARQAVLLTETNPARLLSGQAPLPVPPIDAPRPLWRRVLGLGRG
jgi:protein-tyrosine phosphatase